MSRASIQWSKRDQPGLHSVELVGDRTSVLIGRAPDATVCLPDDDAVSRTHAELTQVDGVWLLEDVGSLAGTFLLRGGRTRRVIGRARLHHGDRVKVGRTILRFQDPPTPTEQIATVQIDDHAIALTKREQQVLDAMCEDTLSGKGGWPTDSALAERLGIEKSTVKTHVRNLFAKFDLDATPTGQKRARLVQRASDEGWANRNDSE